MALPLTETLLGVIATILLWTVSELWKLSKIVASMQTHEKDTDRRINNLETKLRP